MHGQPSHCWRVPCTALCLQRTWLAYASCAVGVCNKPQYWGLFLRDIGNTPWLIFEGGGGGAQEPDQETTAIHAPTEEANTLEYVKQHLRTSHSSKSHYLTAQRRYGKGRIGYHCTSLASLAAMVRESLLPAYYAHCLHSHAWLTA